MRHLWIPSVIAILLALALPAGSTEKTTYVVTYGTVNLGTWNSYAAGKSKAGTYDGTSFDSSGGPGFPTVTLTRPASVADGQNLFASLKPPNVPLTVVARKGKVVVSKIACEKSMPADFGITGKAEALSFACTRVVVSPTKPGPKPH